MCRTCGIGDLYNRCLVVGSSVTRMIQGNEIMKNCIQTCVA